MNSKNKIPKKIFIIPYRDREEYKKKFLERMMDHLNDDDDWEMYFSHQCDKRPFNRGAIKNIGFIAMKIKYPNHYKNISFIFHDIDTLPVLKGVFPYDTVEGKVAHYYGFKFALGGVFVIKGKDFENIKGFPNFWGWGFEDNLLNKRCIINNLIIDRSIFYNHKDKERLKYIERLDKDDGNVKLFTKREIYMQNENPEDITDLKNVTFTINDNFINITNFETRISHTEHDFYLKKVTSTRARGFPGYQGRDWNKLFRDLRNKNV